MTDAVRQPRGTQAPREEGVVGESRPFSFRDSFVLFERPDPSEAVGARAGRIAELPVDDDVT